ncbi:MAG: zinc-binding dehydrogenase [Deltaproteobacteria bacterium]|nr:zinc-binding dehydrogenase [Deltaproteobacteria bacterium]
MKAIRIHRFGSTEEVLEYEDVPAPTPAPGELLVKVEAASLNRADLSLRGGKYRVRPEDLPLIPGREFAGTVAALGNTVRDFRAGERVVAQPGLGGYAEYAVTNTSYARPLPEGVDFVPASAMPTIFLTSWFGLVEEGGMKPGDRVLIQAGSSGVGIAAIQIAKHVGTWVVTTTGSDEKCRRLREVGADEAVNYISKDFKEEVSHLTGGKGVDIVLEMIGGDVYTKSLEILSPGGRLVSIGGAFGPIPDPAPPLSDGRRASRFSITTYLSAHPEAFKQMDLFLELVRQKQFQVVIDRTFPLAEARAAQRYLEGRDHFGKIVLTI